MCKEIIFHTSSLPVIIYDYDFASKYAANFFEPSENSKIRLGLLDCSVKAKHSCGATILFAPTELTNKVYNSFSSIRAQSLFDYATTIEVVGTSETDHLTAVILLAQKYNKKKRPTYILSEEIKLINRATELKLNVIDLNKAHKLSLDATKRFEDAYINIDHKK